MSYVFRPQHIRKTPRSLALGLGFSSVDNPHRLRRRLDYQQDVLLRYPPQRLVDNTPEEYEEVRGYAISNKRDQRLLLALANIRTPAVHPRLGEPSEGHRSTYVVRPLRHRSGQGYRTTTDPTDFDPTTEYIQELYPKAHEYRVIFVRGVPIITLYKRVPTGIDPNGPWNHATGSSFVTVNNPENNRLRHTDAVSRLQEFTVIKHAHIVGADIMIGHDPRDYRVCELNFCPALTIEDNLASVVSHIRNGVA